MSYRERLLRSTEGKQRLARAGAAPQLQASSMLPQIAAHYVRVEGQQKAEVRRMTIERPVVDPLRPLPKAPMFVENLKLGSRISMGRGKWQASTSTVDGATLFDVKAAPRLMEGSQSVLPPQRTIKSAPSLVEIGSVKLRLLPDFTPSRALFWGTVLAAWGTAAVVIRSAKAVGIHSLADVQEKCNDALYPVAERIYDRLEPVREKMVTGETPISQSEFASRLRVTMR